MHEKKNTIIYRKTFLVTLTSISLGPASFRKAYVLTLHTALPPCLPAAPLSSIPFASPQGSTATANLIKLTAIKIRLNYCEALHWHPRSILNQKSRRLIV